MTLRNTVKIKKYGDIIIERLAGGTVTPGMLVKLGSANTVVAHNQAAGNALPKMFALEDELQGKGIDEDYSSTNPVQVWVCQPGEVVYALLYDGETVVIGDALESNGDGTLRKVVADSTGVYYYNQIVGIAYEALDLSGSAGEETTARIPVMIV